MRKESAVVGYRYLKQNKLDPSSILLFDVKEGSSAGRTASRIVKDLLQNTSYFNYKVYLILNAGELTVSGKSSYVIEKYKNKFNAGGKSKGPYYKKSSSELYKLMLRTMMQYKGKHKKIYKKICVLKDQMSLNQLINSNDLQIIDKIRVEVRDSNLTEKIKLDQIIKKI